MAKIKMRRARAPEQGVPEPVKQEVPDTTVNATNVTISGADLASGIDGPVAQRLREMLENARSEAAPGRMALTDLFGRNTARIREAVIGGALTGRHIPSDPVAEDSPLRVVLPSLPQQLVDNLNEARTYGIDTAAPGSDFTALTVMGLNVHEDPSLPEGDVVLATGRVDNRLDRLTAQFMHRSSEALTREGHDGQTRRGPFILEPETGRLHRFLRDASGPHHIVSILHVVYWGFGRRRICMMECVMDSEIAHRGVTTRNAVVAFNVADVSNFSIQPYAGSAQYNETVGFFVYNAARGGRL